MSEELAGLRTEAWNAYRRSHVDIVYPGHTSTFDPAEGCAECEVLPKAAFLAGFDVAAREAASRILNIFREEWDDVMFSQTVVDEFGLTVKGRHR